MTVLDIKTRAPIAPRPPLTDAQKSAAFIDKQSNRILSAALMIRASFGTDLALRALHQAADDIKSIGRKS